MRSRQCTFNTGHGVAHCSLWSVVCEHAASTLTPFAGWNCWAIQSVLDEPTICYRTSHFRLPKTILHDDAITTSCASSRHSGWGREADVLMYTAALSARAFSIAKPIVHSGHSCSCINFCNFTKTRMSLRPPSPPRP